MRLSIPTASASSTTYEEGCSASSLIVVPVTENEISIEAGDIISLKILVSKSKKMIDFAMFSKTLNRPITTEEINGTTFMEARFDEETPKAGSRAYWRRCVTFDRSHPALGEGEQIFPDQRRAD